MRDLALTRGETVAVEPATITAARYSPRRRLGSMGCHL